MPAGHIFPDISQVWLLSNKFQRPPFQRINLVTESISNPASFPDISTSFVSDAVKKKMNIRIRRLEEFIPKAYRKLAKMQEANNRIKCKP